MPILRPEDLEFLSSARRIVLATVAPGGLPRLVPICFAAVAADGGPVLCSAIDEKPKSATDALGLARVRDVAARPAVTLLADRWDEDWSLLAWLRVEAVATLVGPGGGEHEEAVRALRARYPQYRAQALEARPLLRFAPTRAVRWSGAAQQGRPSPGSG